MSTRHPSDSAVEATHIVLPSDTNSHGTAFGGSIMQWMDIAAGIAGRRHCRNQVVTVAVDEIVFERPIHLGDVIIVRASANYVGRTSIEVGVRVDREDISSGEREHCLSGYFTMVSVDKNGKPLPVPPLTAESEIEKRRYKAAQLRRAERLAHKDISC
ncbi:MAG: acyl-CoA thioesterase [Deltaproteobacteria bacterium]|nr:acyl-CoA thioesterase [Deltaproteobacteria bacterium]